MQDGTEYSGRTVEEAIAQAERETGKDRGQLDYEIVTSGRAGVFGFGAEPARIVVRAAAAPSSVAYVPEEQAIARPEESADAAEYVPSLPLETIEDAVSGPVSVESSTPSFDEYDEDEAYGETPDGEESAEGETESDAALADAGAQVLRELLESMSVDAEVSVRSTHDPIMLVITGQNLGVLIGRRGENLSALQFMVNLLLSKNRRQWPRVVIDAENYRARREESLRTLASRIAYRVRRNGRPFTLEAMPASDRRIIHLTLRDDAEVETYSIGEGASRRVVIAPKQAARTPSYGR